VTTPELSIVIPTRDRPELLRAALRSALAQEGADVEVLVVDDGSQPPVALDDDPRLRVLRLEPSQGGSAARNLGAREARAARVLWLDDDDELLPHAARVSLDALDASALPPPVAVLSGIDVVDETGRLLERRLPPDALPRGGHFALEGEVPGRSFHTKQTLVVDRELVLGLGGFDPAFRSRVHSELFLRLNPACSLQGVPVVTYRLRAHAGARVSGNPALRQASFAQLVARHRDAFAAHPDAYAAVLLQHARTSWGLGQRAAALRATLTAARVAPRTTATRAAGALRDARERLAARRRR
jgi:hypothetical protein